MGDVLNSYTSRVQPASLLALAATLYLDAGLRPVMTYYAKLLNTTKSGSLNITFKIIHISSSKLKLSTIYR